VTVLLGIATRMRLARLLLITGLRDGGDDLAGFVGDTLDAGVDIVQLRDPRAGDAALAAGFRRVREVVLTRKALAALYDALTVAEEVQADLLQVSERGPAAATARKHVHAWAQIGRSCHSRRQVDAALRDPDVNFLTVGPVFGTGLLPVGGVELVSYAARQAPPSDPSAKPWFAVGGITGDNLAEVLEAGARRVAVSRAITDATDPAAATAALKERLSQAWRDDPGMQSFTLRSFGR
jgi:thiamine-phosphate pyrophosphorylase